MHSRSLLLLGAALSLSVAGPALGQAPPMAPEVVVTARRLDAARAEVQPALGASTYSLPKAFIENMPSGANAQLDQVLLQAPGAAKDSFGQLHIRGDHGNLQYRLNNVILPEGLQLFGQALSPRLADNVRLITGALPAQYGLRTAGIVDITTKSGLQTGGEAGIYGGAQGRLEPSIEYGGAFGSTSIFASASYTGTDVGIESPDGRAKPLHDHSDQYQAFGYLEHILDADSRLSLIVGTSQQRFEIPNVSGLHPQLGYVVNGVSDIASDDLDARQREAATYAIASYLLTTGRFTGQASLFGRYSELRYSPDITGELLFNGLAQSARKSDLALGAQIEGVYKLSDDHTLRGGLIASTDETRSRTRSDVFRLNPVGAQLGEPVDIPERGDARAWTVSAYLQDEWSITPSLTLNYGLRFDQVDAFRKESQLSPRLNLVWRPLEGTTVHLGYARYFSPPPFELVASTTVARFVGTSAEAPGMRNDPPRAERDHYFDAGVEQRLGRFSLGVDAYYKKARNLIDEGQFGAPIILTPFNYRSGSAKGVELTTGYEKRPFSAYANLALSRARAKDIISSQFNFDPADLAYIAAHRIFLDHDQTRTASAGAAWRLGTTRLSADVIYGSGLRRDGDVPNGARMPAYAQVNLGVLHTFAAAGLTVRADVINLFDARYQIRDGTGVGVGAPQWGPRRGVFAGLSKSF